MTSNVTRLMNAFLKGEALSTKQISARYKARNPRDLVYKLRNEGMNIDLIARTNSKGVTNRFYVLAE